MPQVRIEYERDVCIGANVCAAEDPDHFTVVDDGKVKLKGGTEEEQDKWAVETELTEEEVKRVMAAAQGCPVNAIHVIVDGEKRI